MTKKLIVLDTETTGLEVEQGHRIVEVGAVALADRNDSFGTNIAIVETGVLLIARPPPTAVRTIGPRSDSKTHRPLE